MHRQIGGVLRAVGVGAMDAVMESAVAARDAVVPRADPFFSWPRLVLHARHVIDLRAGLVVAH